MKTSFFTIVLALIFLNGYGQSTEFRIQLNSGFFRYSGGSTEKIGQINYNLDTNDGYTNNPYGNQFGFSYGFSANVMKINSYNLRFGVDFGYEMLRSRMEINKVWQHDENISESIPATGKTNLNASFMNLFPSIGYQMPVSSFELYFDTGFDLAYCASASEKGAAESAIRKYETSRDRKNIDFDLRPRMQIGIKKDKLGMYVGYSKGLVNYKSGYDGGTNIANSEIIRTGFTYKIF